MAGKSMEQRVKDGSLRARWKSAQSKNKALDDRKFGDLSKLLDSYDDAVEEYEAGAGDDGDITQGTVDKVNVAMTAFMNKNQQLHKSLNTLESDFSKSMDTLTRKRAERVNQYSILISQLAEKRKAVFADFVDNDRTTSDKVLDIVADLADTLKATAKLQEDLGTQCEKLATQIRNTVQNYKRQVASTNDKNAIASLDELLALV